tara:strand:- start:6048 stop:6308 length:261 start_codon:yes stop_codon:yes gene_type:complete
MLNNILNIEGVSLLPKEQQKAINGGYMQEPCAVFLVVTWGEGYTGWTSKTLDVETAQYYYNNRADLLFGPDQNQAVTGYCCASCPF